MFTHITYYFEHIISSLDVMFNLKWSSESERISKFVFGDDYMMELVDSDNEDLQMWCIDELDKAINGGYVQRYTFKNPIDLGGEYVGPVQAWMFEPDGPFDDQVIVLTCNSTGLFKNNRYVCGLSICNGDFERNIEKKEEKQVESAPSKEEIEKVLGSGARYTVQDHGTIDVEWAAFGKLRLHEDDCPGGRLPFRFGKVDVGFECAYCGLTTLEGAPKYVRGDFKCNNNKLASLVGGPEKVTGSYYCQNNQLTSLVGAPKEVGEITEDTYESFDTGESWVTGYSSYEEFDCQNNQITTLEGVEMHVMGTLRCAGNRISQKKKFKVVVEAGTVRWGKQNLVSL